MSAEMPERIWAYIWDPGEVEVNGVWDTTKRDDATEYVLASTHQRVIEALREARAYVARYSAVRDREATGGPSDHENTQTLAKIDAALAAIKEHTP